MESGLSGFKG